MRKCKLKLNADLKGYKSGAIINVDLDSMKSKYWRNRLIDAKIDKCVEIIEETMKGIE